MTNKPTFTGIGRLYFCRVEDRDKEPQPLGEPMTIKPGMLTYKDDDGKSEYSAKEFRTTFTGTVQEPVRELTELQTRPALWDVILEHNPGCMPRKMKKAIRCRYSRDTKWKRKAATYLSRLRCSLRDAEIVVTREQFDSLSATITATVKPAE